MTKVEITVNKRITLQADWEDNVTARTLLSQMPFSIKMSNLYGREMCHRFGAGSLPVKGSQNSSYVIGDIAYWPPMGSLVILYDQNGEVFEQVPIGHISQDLHFFEGMYKAELTFRKVEN